MQKQPHYFWILFFLSFLLFFPSLGKLPLWIYDEVRNAECAREMRERHDWIVPTFNGELRTHKPVLHYYFMWAGFELFGVGEWGARFFSAWFGWLTLLITYCYIARFSSRLHAFVSCCVLLASTHFLFEFRMSVPDPYLIFFNTLSLFSAYQYFSEKKLSALIICALSFGCGLLVKGPVAFALPGISIFCWLLWQRKWKAIFHGHLVLAFVMMMLIALPWYIAVHKATHSIWTHEFFLKNNIGRFSEPMEGHGGWFILVPLFILIGLLPASVFMGEAFTNFKNRFHHPLLRLALCTVLTFAVFYSISRTKLPNYPMPCYPFAALILAQFMVEAINNKSKIKSYPFILLMILNMGLTAGLYLGIKNETALASYQNQAFLVGILLLTAALAILVNKKKDFKKAVLVLLAGYTLFHLIFFNYLFPGLYQHNPLSKTIHLVNKYRYVVGYKMFQPSFTFYLPHRVQVFQQADSLKHYLQSHQALVLTRLNFVPELDSLPLHIAAQHHDLFEDHTTVLLTNEK